VCLPLFECEPASAQSSTGGVSQSTRWRVHVELIAGVASDDFEGLLREWFRLNSVDADFHRATTLDPSDVLNRTADTASLRVWVTLLEQTQARVYFVEPVSHRFLVRDVPLRPQFDELAREQLAQVVVTSADAFMARRASTSEQDFTRALNSASEGRAESRPPLAKPAPSTHAGGVPAPTTFVRVGAFYRISLEQKEVIAHGPGLVMGATHRSGGYHFNADVSAQYLLPHTVSTPDVNLVLHGAALRIAIGAERQWDKIAVGAAFGGGADAVSYEPRLVSGAGIAPQPGAWLWRPVLIGDLRVLRTWGRTQGAFVIGAGTYLKKTQYVVVRDGAASTCYQPWLIEPHAAIELTWN
jgi:hypothetical protein